MIFLTGQREVNSLVRKLQKAFPLTNRKLQKVKKKKAEENESVCDDSEEEDELSMEKAIQKARKSLKKKQGELALPDINLDEYVIQIWYEVK